MIEEELFCSHNKKDNNSYSIYLESLSMNPNPEIIPIFYRLLHQEFYYIDSMEQKMKKITRNILYNLVQNKKNPQALSIIEQFVYFLGIDFLEQQVDIQFWELLSENPHIFVESTGMK